MISEVIYIFYLPWWITYRMKWSVNDSTESNWGQFGCDSSLFVHCSAPSYYQEHRSIETWRKSKEKTCSAFLFQVIVTVVGLPPPALRQLHVHDVGMIVLSIAFDYNDISILSYGIYIIQQKSAMQVWSCSFWLNNIGT